MKKILFLLSVMVLYQTVMVAQDRYIIISHSRLNVRSLPSSDSWILGTVTPMEEILVYNIAGDWAEIKYNNQTAYVSVKYIKKVNAETESSYGMYKVTLQALLNIRSQPSVDSQILGVLQPNEHIEVLSIEEQWAKIKYESLVGYVALKYVEKVDESKNVQEAINDDKDVAKVVTEKEPVVSEVSNDKKEQMTINIFSKDIGMELLPNLSIGYANFVSDRVTPVSTVGLELGCAIQIIAKKNILFIPEDYFTEVLLGYSLRGSGAFPMHYLTFKLLPLGYKVVMADYAFSGKLGTYMAVSPSVVKTKRNKFKTNVDVGISLGLGIEKDNIGIGFSFEQGVTDVCDANLSLKNQCLFINLTYRLYDIRKRTFIK